MERRGRGVDAVGGEVGAEVEALQSKHVNYLICGKGRGGGGMITYEYQHEWLRCHKAMRPRQKLHSTLLQAISQCIPPTSILNYPLIYHRDNRRNKYARSARRKRICTDPQPQLRRIPFALRMEVGCRCRCCVFHSRHDARGDDGEFWLQDRGRFTPRCF